MRRDGWAIRVLLGAAACIGFTALLAGCSDDSSDAGSNQPASAGTASPTDVEDICRTGAEQIVERFEAFLEPYADTDPQDFLAQSEIEGLSAFQADVALIIDETANENSTLCDLNGLQRFVAAELDQLESPDLVTSYLVSTIRFGGNLETADVAVGPDDDLSAIMGLLDDGSTITFEPGTYRLDTPLLVTRDLAMYGAGQDETILESTAGDAALAVFGGGDLVLRDLTVSHSGDRPASVVLAYGAPIDAERVTVRGGRGEAEAGGTGNGILLSAGEVEEPGAADDTDAVGDGDREDNSGVGVSPDVADSRMIEVTVTDNDVAGIAVNDRLEPAIVDATITDNRLCGICFLGDSGGIVESSRVEQNAFGIQVGDRAAPIVRNNTLSNNEVVGLVAVGDATPLIEGNEVEDNAEGGIAIQEAASPEVRANAIGTQPFGLTVVGTSAPLIADNDVTGPDVGVQVAESATPTLRGNRFRLVEIAALVVRDMARPEILATTVDGAQSVALLVEGSAVATVDGLQVLGGEVGASFRESATGTLANSAFTNQAIGVQIEDEAEPTITATTFERHRDAAIVARSNATPIIQGNTFREVETLGIGVAGSSSAVVEGNEVVGGETALSLIEDSTAQVRSNSFTDQLVAVQVADSAEPDMRDNTITRPGGVGVVFRDDSGGRLEGNTIIDPGTVGVQLIDAAAPTIVDNTIVSGVLPTEETEPSPALGEGDPQIPEDAGQPAAEIDDDPTADEGDDGAGAEGDQAEGDQAGGAGAEEDPITVAILISGSAAPVVEANQLLGFVVGIQAEVEAMPELRENVVDGGELLGVGMLFRDAAGGIATANRTRLHSIGIQVDDEAKPELIDNVIEWASDVAILLQGSSAARVSGSSCPDGVAGIGVRSPASPELGDNGACAVVTADA